MGKKLGRGTVNKGEGDGGEDEEERGRGGKREGGDR